MGRASKALILTAGGSHRVLEAQVDELPVTRLFWQLGGCLEWVLGVEQKGHRTVKAERIVTGGKGKWVEVRSFKGKNWKDLPVFCILWGFIG